MVSTQQTLYATFFVEDALRHFLFEERISWIPARPLVAQEVHMKMNNFWRFAENFASAMRQAKFKFGATLNSEISGIMYAVRRSEARLSASTLHSAILSLAQRLSYKTYDGFFAFLSTIIDLCILFFKEGQNQNMYVVINAAVSCMMELAPNNINLMFHILHSFSTRLLDTCRLRDLFP